MNSYGYKGNEIDAENPLNDVLEKQTEHAEDTTTLSDINLMLAKAADETGLVPDMSTFDFASLVLDKIIEEDDASAYDTWHHVFPQLGLSRNDSIVEKYGLESSIPHENRLIRFPDKISFALGGVDINATPKVLLVAEEDLANFDIPDFRTQIKNAHACITSTPEAELNKVESIDTEIDLFIVPGEMRYKKTNLK